MLVVGGAGVFGSRLIDAVLATTTLSVIVAGRDPQRGAAFIATRGNNRISFTKLDARAVTPAALRATDAFVVVDAAGPFQGQDDHLARAAIEAGLHYIDLADSRAFVGRIGTLNAAARIAGVAVLSGASSTPALSNAVLDKLVAGWHQVDAVSIAISPGNRAPRGLSVIQSILSYVGQPLRVFLNGAWCLRPGWGMTRRANIAGLGRRYLSLCDTPDLDIVVQRFRVRRSVRFDAGLELPWLHVGLVAASALVRTRLVPSLVPLASLVQRAAALVETWGTDRGAMVVEARGLNLAGDPVQSRWTLLAEAGDGPSIPTLPAMAVLRALTENRLTWRGAAPCVDVLTLAAIEREFGTLKISTETQTHRDDAGSVFPPILADQFASLPAPIRAVHQPGWTLTLKGQAQVEGASGTLAALVARVFGFPRAAPNVAVTVTIDRTATGERWTRIFGPHQFASRLSVGRKPGLLREQFGPFAFDVAISATEGGLRMQAGGWRIGPLPLPRRAAPVSHALESVDAQGRFTFDVRIGLPFGWGQIVRYRGWLRPAP